MAVINVLRAGTQARRRNWRTITTIEAHMSRNAPNCVFCLIEDWTSDTSLQFSESRMKINAQVTSILLHGFMT
ncbi:hypothetical protein AX768_12520 [Burkholderia sp. PAMC 28687]|nr:hypothetical protein AX768_12520 [Burkholderia sp. PAMC 28687]